MSTKSFTFDPEAGVPSAADLALYGGANFRNIFNVTTTSNTKYDLTGWTGSAQMRKVLVLVQQQLLLLLLPQDLQVLMMGNLLFPWVQQPQEVLQKEDMNIIY